MRFTHDGVPQQKSHGSTDDQHDKCPQRSGFVLRFKVQIERSGHPRKQHKHFIQVADRDMTDIRADQIAFIPAHHGADERHANGHPGNGRPHDVKGSASAHIQAFTCGVGRLAARKHADPVKNRAHEKQHAHPQNG